MTQRTLILGLLGLTAASSACIDLKLPNPIPLGVPFIVQGTFEERPLFGGGTCPVWVDTTGIVYHLFQDEFLPNADFDRITTPGVTSRLQVTVRDDLQVGCRMGATAVVLAILEVSG